MRALIAAALLALTGCAGVVGDHPFSSMPKGKGMHAEKPEFRLQYDNAHPMCASKLDRETGQPVAELIARAWVTWPRVEHEQMEVRMTVHTGSFVMLGPGGPSPMWILRYNGGLGQHTVVAEWMRGDLVVHQLETRITVYQCGPIK